MRNMTMLITANNAPAMPPPPTILDTSLGAFLHTAPPWTQAITRTPAGYRGRLIGTVARGLIAGPPDHFRVISHLTDGSFLRRRWAWIIMTA